MSARYRATTRLFLAPFVIEEGREFFYDGIPSIHMDPVNDEAKAAYEKIVKAKPLASRDPLEHLPRLIDPKDALVKEAPKHIPSGAPTPPTIPHPVPPKAPAAMGEKPDKLSATGTVTSQPKP